MRIQGPKHFGPASAATERQDKSEGADKAKAHGKPGGDVVDIGKSARALGEQTQLGPAIKARLEEVRAQLKSGSYAVDFDRLAANILDDEAARSAAE